MTWLDEHADVECCDIVTTGRVSGNPHEVEIWFGVLDGALYLISGNGPGADWYRNILAAPGVLVKLAGEAHIGVMLPCNLIVQEYEDGRVEVAAIDPIATMVVRVWGLQSRR